MVHEPGGLEGTRGGAENGTREEVSKKVTRQMERDFLKGSEDLNSFQKNFHP